MFWAGGKEYFTSANGLSSLATASFGQTFKITPIRMITSFSSVINGGHLLEPYTVEKISAAMEIPCTTMRRLRCTRCSVRTPPPSSGKSWRAWWPMVQARTPIWLATGIGGKTGTSEKRDEDTGDVIVSFMGFAPADDPQVVVLVALDSPKRNSPGSNYTASGTYISGGNMAAPIAGQLIAEILDYMGYEKQYTSDELSGADAAVPSLVGYDLDSAAEKLEKAGFAYRTVGEGSTVTGQLPAGGLSIPAAPRWCSIWARKCRRTRWRCPMWWV